MIKRTLLSFFLMSLIVWCGISCAEQPKAKETDQPIEVPFLWENATVYFLLTDRFNNGDSSNDLNFDRTDETAVMRGFQGGDIKGITQKINEGYFNDLGINAIWFTPVVEQIHGGVDEGTGFTYGFHGYWTKDWTSLDPNFGTLEDLQTLVETAHSHGIRILMDAVINHTGPVTEKDPVWPEDWVRTGPKCTYDNYKNSIECTLVDNLPDILTESNEEVQLPPQLVEKWKREGRHEQEMEELEAFFARTGYPRAPKYYIIKWLTDFIRDYGIDGFRADTVRHIEEEVWATFKDECNNAFESWKQQHPEKVLDNTDFYMVGEVYGYELITAGKSFDFGDKKVNYYDHGFDAMINFEFKKNATGSYEDLFATYSKVLNDPEKGYQALNYLSSHDDGGPFDKYRKKPYETATKLLLSPGTAQVYYGDESARILHVEGAEGDAQLRSFMNWNSLSNNDSIRSVHTHWQKLGSFRAAHPAVGAGKHTMISEKPYVFERSYTNDKFEDRVIIGLDLASGIKKINMPPSVKECSQWKDAYSGTMTKVENGVVEIDSEYSLILLSPIN